MHHDKFGKEQDQKDLGKLGRLKGSESQINPACRPIDFISDHQYRAQDQHDESIDDPVKVQHPHIVDQGYDDHCDNPYNHADNLS